MSDPAESVQAVVSDEGYMVESAQYFRLSPQQKRLWVLQQESSAYRAIGTVLIEGLLQPAALTLALSQVVARHDILRTSFQHLPNIKLPFQVVAESDPLVCQMIDVTAASPESQAATVDALFQTTLRMPLDDRQPALRAPFLIALAPNRHLLLLDLPALCADTRTLQNLLAELSEAYALGMRGQELDAPVVQYIQFSEWQHQLLEEDEAAAGFAYWQAQNPFARSVPTLPCEIKAAPTHHFAPVRQTLQLDRDASARVIAGAARLTASIETVLLSCWQTLLWRLTQQQDFVVGTLYDGRAYEELADVLGLFARWLPVSCQIEPSLRFDELVQRTAETMQAQREWQDYFVIDAAPDAEENGNAPPFFALGFEYAEYSSPSSAADLVFTLGQHYTCLEQFRLKLVCVRSQDQLSLELHSDPDRFSSADVATVAQQLCALLEAAVADPSTRLSDIEIMSAAERERVLVAFNDTAAAYPRQRAVHHLFEDQALRTPDADAVVFADQRLTYVELNRRANQLAHELRALGVGPETRVGIYMERSLDLIVCVLGILKAGGAYLPLDIIYPRTRLNFMVQDAGVPVLLTHTSLLAGCPETTARIIALDAIQDRLASQPGNTPTVSLQPDNLAYVLYTSGSTGTPKGAMISHQGLVNYLAWATRAYAVADGCGAPVHSPIGFDLTVTSLFTPLLAGRAAVLLPEHEGIEALIAALQSGTNFSLVKLTPAHLEVLNQQLPAAQLANQARALIIGGEALRAETLSFWQAHAPATRLINEYGPTETVVGCCVYEALPDSALPSVVPIGRPIANTQMYVLDERLEPTPIGLAGEVYIGGDGLARGYLARPGLTAELFIPNPFSHLPGTRLYRTGDLARYRADGTLEFLGRVDDQVKIRGFRIELGEIEAVLSQHRDVRDVVVLTHAAAGDTRLVAYIVADSGAPPSVADLRANLMDRLPEYMIPAAFVVLPALPLTANGKVDRKALPAPETFAAGHAEQGRALVAPRTPTEELLVGIWAEVLGLPVIGIHDQFFDLGGHSLLATQVIARVRTIFQVEIPLRSLIEAPTIAGLAEQIVSAQRDDHRLTLPPLAAVAHDQHLPLSFAQQRLWFLDQLQPHSAAYNMPSALLLHGPLDASALEQSLQALVQRHAVLRTTFPTVESQPRQHIAPTVPERLLAVRDLRDVPEATRLAVARQHAVAEAQQPFDLARGPLLRATLLQLGATEHVLLLTLHHIVADGWSLEVAVRELGAHYAAASQGRPAGLPALAVQYADYAVWQRQWLQGDVLAAHLAYWRQQLADVPVLELPGDYPRPAAITFHGGRHQFSISSEVHSAVLALSRQAGVTPFMTLLAAFQVLLQRSSGQDDIVVGTPIANRTVAETEDLIGCFVNMLALRTRFDGAPTFRHVLRQVREVALDAYAHQDVPFEQIVETVQPARDLSRHPLFQVSFALQTAPPTLTMPELMISSLEAPPAIEKFDLTLWLAESGDGLSALFNYRTDLFDPDTLARMAGHFQTLLAALVADPDQRIRDLPLLTAAERRQVLHEWNATAQIFEGPTTLHGLVEAQVARTPDAVAVVYEESTLSYHELDRQANQLAQYLWTQGVGPENRVGVCLERSPLLVVALLGVLKAGAAYVPLDPAYPVERLQFMCEDAQLVLLLTQQHLRALLPIVTVPVLALDADAPLLAAQAEHAPRVAIAPAHPAYIIYTSGSTGRPKGAVIPHQAIVNHMQWMQMALPLAADDRVLQKTPISFDASVWEFYAPLGSGAQVVLARPGGHQDAAYLVATIQAQQITILQVVPTLLRLLLDTGALAGCSSLRRVFCGGEALLPELVAQFQGQLPQVALHNLYGPTEAAIESTTWACGAESGTSVPIGRPVANMAAYVLDERQEPMPVGVAGELYLGGTQVGRGYLGQPGLTAERFVPDGVSGAVGRRLYRTGDRVRRRAGGELEFLGRVDYQVKLRGQLIELGEIEAVLRAQAAVGAAVVLLREDRPGDQRLVAYVVGAGEAGEVGSEALRKRLRTRLPEYMIPTAFVVLPALPLTANGKVDRKALPVPEHAEQAHALVAPRTPTEELLAGIWAEVLGLPAVGIHDQFFDLGGHSLLATQVVTRVRRSFRIDLPLRDLFEVTTVAGLAERITVARAERPELAAPPLVAVAHDQHLPLSFAQQRLWFLDQLQPHSAAYNMPSALLLHGPLDASALEQSLQALVQRHAVLRTTFPTVESQPRQRIAPTVPERLLALRDLRDVPEATRLAVARQHAAAEAQQPFDLARGPLLRATLLTLGATEHVLLLTLHHIVADGWSLEVAVRELGAHYAAVSQGRPAGLPALAVQYADYAVWQRQWLQGDVLAAHLDYWRQQLADAPAMLALPTDYPRPATQTFNGAVQTFALSGELTAALKTLSQQEDATLFMTLLAGFNILLFSYSGQEDILIGSPIAGRTLTETEDLIGFFVNTLVLRTDLSGNPTFRELLQRVREVCLGAYSHQDIPVDLLLEALRPRRDLSRTMLLQVAFALQNMPHATRQPLADLTLTPLDVTTGTSKLDLTLSMVEDDDRLIGSIEYNTDLFTPATITRMLTQLQTVLERIVADPSRQIVTHLPFVSATRTTQTVVTDLYERTNLTRNQLLVWLGQQFQPDLPLYNSAAVCLVHGPVDPTHIERALAALVQASDALRTVIEERDGVPTQRIVGHMPYTLQQVDLSDAPDPQVACRAWVRERSQMLFRLDTCLFDVALLKLGAADYCFYINKHHIITDGWSHGVVAVRLVDWYGQSVRGELPASPTMPVFQDYVAYERANRTSARAAKAQAYWSHKLAQPVEPLAFYGKLPRKQHPYVHRCSYDLGLERTERLKQFAARQGNGSTTNAGLFQLFAGVLFMYLYRMTGLARTQESHRLAIGVPFHNRRTHAFKETIGLFMEVLPVHITVAPNDTFQSVLQKVAADVGETMRYSQHTVSTPHQQRRYDVILNYHVASVVDFGGFPADLETVDPLYANDSMIVQIHDYVASGSLGLDFGFHNDSFDADQRAVAVQQFFTLLDAALVESERPIDLLPLDAAHAQLPTVPQTAMPALPLPAQATVLDYVEAQVKQTPHQVALVCGDETLTYAELNTRANQVARHLRALGVGPERRVGLCVGRSPDLIVGALGILKSGGAYVPLDPAYPHERLSLILHDAQASVVLTQSWLADRLPQHGVTRVCLDTDWPEIAQASGENLTRLVTPDNLAYLIYTSGSTGVPKGVMVQHRSLAYYTETAWTTYCVEPADRMLQFASISFDASAEEIYPALSRGATLVLRTDTMMDTAATFLQRCQEWGITILSIPTTYWHELIAQRGTAGSAFPATIRLVIIGAEQALPERLAVWQRWVSPHVRLVNTYGPTEATIVATMHELVEPAAEVRHIPIGHAIPGTQTYLLNRYLAPVASYVPGELYIGGSGLARGYLHQPALTAERFVPDPFSTQPGARLYRTGDVARTRIDGTLEFLGRVDQQVKIRGFRIELGEIEAVLRQFEGVYQAVVVVRDDRPSASGVPDKYLVGYVVPYPQQSVDSTALRRFVQDKLPNYMVPSALVMLEALPMTPNDKVDRAALPVPEQIGVVDAATFVAPRTPTELLIARSWSEVLGVEQVGVHDNFFDLGGHSLLVTQVVARLRDTFQVELSLRTLFEAQTVAELAAAITQAQAASAAPSAQPALVPVSRTAYRVKRNAAAAEPADDAVGRPSAAGGSDSPALVDPFGQLDTSVAASAAAGADELNHAANDTIRING